MSGRNKAIIAGVFFSLLILVGAGVAVLIALRQTPEKPVAPTVPQITPHAEAPTTTAACKLTFTVAAETHKECANNACVSVPGAGADNCPNNCAQTYKFKKCENNACKEQNCVPNTTPCSGLSTCQSDSNCQSKFQHKVCLGQSCSVVDCSPPTVQCGDSCTSDVNCAPVVPPPPSTPSATHRVCQNRACVLVAGAGTDTCISDVACQPVAKAPPIPKSGNTALTIGGIVLGVGALVVGLLILL